MLGIKDYLALINTICSILRPGGMCLLQEGDLKPLDDEMNLITPEDPAYSAVPRFFGAVSTAMRARQGQIDAAPHVFGWVSAQDALEDVHEEELMMPVGQWYPDPSTILPFPIWPAFKILHGLQRRKKRRLPMKSESSSKRTSRSVFSMRRLSTILISPTSQTFVHAARPLLLGAGLPPKAVEDIQYKTLKELNDGCPSRVQCKLYCVWARKKRTPPQA